MWNRHTWSSWVCKKTSDAPKKGVRQELRCRRIGVRGIRGTLPTGCEGSSSHIPRCRYHKSKRQWTRVSDLEETAESEWCRDSLVEPKTGAEGRAKREGRSWGTAPSGKAVALCTLDKPALRLVAPLGGA